MTLSLAEVRDGGGDKSGVGWDAGVVSGRVMRFWARRWWGDGEKWGFSELSRVRNCHGLGALGGQDSSGGGLVAGIWRVRVKREGE